MNDMRYSKKERGLPKSFWVLWGVEFWERFGYYGVQAILAIFFVSHLGFNQKQSIYLFGAFAAFVFGFVWIGGFIGDDYLGAKRSIVIGAVILMLSYFALAFATKDTASFALAGIVVGNALFKANPSSLISKLFKKGDSALDSAMTMYYMAINVGGFLSMALTPVVAHSFGYSYAFMLAGFGLFCGLLNFFVFFQLVKSLATPAGKKPMKLMRLFIIIIGAMFSIVMVGYLLEYPRLCYGIVAVVVSGGFLYFLKIAFSLHGIERKRMLVAFILILEGILFFVLYFQQPTSLTFFALHNLNNHVLGFTIPAAEYQVLNPFWIVVMSPVLAWFYRRVSLTHVDKFCIGMTFCAAGFSLLWLPQFFTSTGIVSPLWIVATYYLQSTGELLISALGLAMVAELCPRAMSGFVMGIWFLTTMLAGPIAAWIGGLTSPPTGIKYTALQSIHVYGNIFSKLGLFTAFVAIIMWLTRAKLNSLIIHKHIPGEEVAEHLL